MSSDFQVPPGYVLVPRWGILLGFAVLVAALILGLFTFPASPASNTPVANAPQVVPTVNLAPRTITSASRTLGDPNAPIQLVEYSDFQCPYCRKFALSAGRSLEEQFVKTGKVSITYKYYPILDRGGADGESHWSAYAAECANRQGKFWEYHDKLFSAWQGDASRVGAFTKANLKKLAADLKLDASAFAACLDGDQTKPIVAADVAEGRQLKVNGTPAFFVNGQPFFPNGLDLSAFAPILGSAR